MSGRPALIRQRDAKQIIKAAQKAGLEQVEFYIGDIRVKVPLVPEKSEAEAGDWVDVAE